MVKIIGKCSICGGRVTVPSFFLGIYPPVPQCLNCGATAKPGGPVIDMVPPRLPHVTRGI